MIRRLREALYFWMDEVACWCARRGFHGVRWRIDRIAEQWIWPDAATRMAYGTVSLMDIDPVALDEQIQVAIRQNNEQIRAMLALISSPDRA